eukprot:15327362-Ditylum_brightwellii.AAC.1
MYVNEDYFKISYGDPLSIDNIPELPSKPYDRYTFPLLNALAEEDYSKLDNMSQEPENEYILMQDYWEPRKDKRNGESGDDEAKMYNQETDDEDDSSNKDESNDKKSKDDESNDKNSDEHQFN